VPWALELEPEERLPDELPALDEPANPLPPP